MNAAAPALPRPIVWWFPLLVTLLFAGPNVVKPLHIDDTAYFNVARQLAAHPLDPYGFYQFWYQEPQPANTLLAPPVLPYTWALGLRLFGDNPIACKLLLLPWSFLLVCAVYALARRFAPELDKPLTILIILSPALWPSINVMLDIPALALALTAIALFLRACDDKSFFLAACAGLCAGVGFETKYTAIVAVAAILLAALLRRRLALGFVAVVLAAHVVCVTELLFAILYDKSHFLNRFPGGSTDDALKSLLLTKAPLCMSLVSLLGGVGPALLLLGLAACGARRIWLVFTAVLFLGGVLAIALFNDGFMRWLASAAYVFGVRDAKFLQFESADVIFTAFGCVLVLVTSIVAAALIRSETGAARLDSLFLLGWLLLEIAAFFPLTEFPAVRRVLGILIPLALLLGRYAALRVVRAGSVSDGFDPAVAYASGSDEVNKAERRTIYRVAAFGVLVGFALFSLDFRCASVHRQGAERAAQFIRDQGGGRVWYAGHWGFQYYAERNGMKAVIPSATWLKRGDWLVLPDERRIHQQTFQIDDVFDLREVVVLTFDDGIPLRTVWCFYSGSIPVEQEDEPRLRVRIYRVERDFLPQ